MVSHYLKAKMESVNNFFFFLNLNNNYFFIGNFMGILAMLAPLALGMVGPPLRSRPFTCVSLHLVHIHGYQMMIPDFGDPFTFPPAPPQGCVVFFIFSVWNVPEHIHWTPNKFGTYIHQHPPKAELWLLWGSLNVSTSPIIRSKFR